MKNIFIFGCTLFIILIFNECCAKNDYNCQQNLRELNQSLKDYSKNTRDSLPKTYNVNVHHY